MSIKIMSSVFDSSINTTEKFVLLAIADHANEEGLAYPSITTIQRKTSLSRPCVVSCISKLINLNVLEKIEGFNTPRKCKKNQNFYRILVNKVNQLSTLTSKRDLPELVNQVNQQLVNDVNPEPSYKTTNRIVSNKKQISGSVEVGSEMTLPCHSGRVRNDLKVGSEMTQIITEVNNRNKKILKNPNIGTHEQKPEFDSQHPKKPKRNTREEKQKFAQRIKELWHVAVVEHGIKKTSKGIGVTDTDINNIQRIIKYAKDDGSAMDYSSLETWPNYFNELFRICKRKDFLQKCIKGFSWAVKPNTYQKLADDTYLNLEEVA